jgi:superfamily I DNA/RNA helicase/mRNA-degrading endonuclease RelE of RelBE toxin-antitoxin system
MEFRISDTFTASLARLTSDEQKAVKTAAFDLQLNPAHPSFQFHKLDKAKDKNFWSVRVSNDVRLIVHRTASSLLLCYVGHHDDAYNWGERRKLETHPRTGAAQLVEVRETVQEIVVPRYVESPLPSPPKPPLFANTSEDELLAYGVPPGWMGDVRHATEDGLLEILDHLPAEAAEALLNLATGVKPAVVATAPATVSPFQHPDAQRRFRLMTNIPELERALDYPWEKWTVFLHPAQRQLVERDYSGPARAAGSAGTGKTIVALHRAVHLAHQNPEARVLLTTFSEGLANALRSRMRVLIGNEPRVAQRIEVHAMNAVGRRLYEANFGPAQIATEAQLRELLLSAAKVAPENKFKLRFLAAEWEQVVDAWQVGSWEAYRDVPRLGRKTRLPEKQRAILWSIFERVRAALKEKNMITWADLFTRLASHFAKNTHPPFDFAIVDEAQDLSVAQLRFLAALGGNRANSLLFAGDLGQRIFQQPFSWQALGVNVRGRSHTLKINYRTSHQIRTQADRLLGPEVSDVDGNTDERRGTISVFNGPPPAIEVFDSSEKESAAVARWIQQRTEKGIAPHETAVFVRSEAQIDRARVVVSRCKLPFRVLDDKVETAVGHVSIGTMHFAKGLEFRAVAVMACDDEVIPLQARIETVGDEADLEEVYNSERNLLYVACTRARDQLLVTGVTPASEFLDDLRSSAVQVQIAGRHEANRAKR